MAGISNLGAAAIVDAAAAGERVRVAITAASGNLRAAASALGVKVRTLSGLLHRLPGGEGYETARAWVDDRFPQLHNPRKRGRRRTAKKNRTRKT